MGFNCGIIGLPNVGKSTFFNALMQKNVAQAANFPFCTIKPNVGDIIVPDERLQKITSIAHSQNTIPTKVSFTDIAGLVKGASKGEGMGNQFLSHIRQVDVIFHVVRCFEDNDITHVDGAINPIADADIINTELMLADLESLERRLSTLEKKIKQKDAEAIAFHEAVQLAYSMLKIGCPARMCEVPPNLQYAFDQLQLLTAKDVVYLCNVDEHSMQNGNPIEKHFIEKIHSENASCLRMCAKMEEELIGLDANEQQEYLESYGINETSLTRIIKTGYQKLGLLTYYTAGEKEARAWTITHDTLAPQAAGKIHTDFEKGFIRAEVIDYESYLIHNGEAGAKQAGKMRLEGKEYIVKDGDIMHFRFAV